MADILANAAEWVRDQVAAHISRAVTYTRGAYSVTVYATVGRTNFRTTDTNGRSILIRSDRDYLIDPTAIVLNGSQSEPARGDRITDGAEVYEVYSPTGEPCFRSSDPTGKMLRIHTRRET